MARPSREKVFIDNKTYYTSNYFAGKTHTSVKTARRFLTSYSEIPGSKNPKLFTYQTIHIAMAAYLNRQSEMYAQSVREEILEKERAEEEEKQSRLESTRAAKEAGYEEDSMLAYLNGKTEEKNVIDEAKSLQRAVETRANKDFIKVALQHLLGINGYAFNFEQYEKDLYTDISHEEYREPGQSRGAVQRAARKRLASSTAYLIKIDGLK